MKLPTIFASVFAAGVAVHLVIAHAMGYFSLYQAGEIDRVSSSLSPESAQSRIAEDSLLHVYNDTLGFGEVFVISLRERSDKRDTISVQAALSNISLTFVDGVVGKEVSEKALPYGLDRTPPEVGCWRSHLDVMQRMVQQRIQSALIFEDDADWDVAIKAQMLQVARGSRWLLDSSGDRVPSSPYGDGWDVLWIGHCSAEPIDRRRWVIPKDPTVVPPSDRGYWFKPDMTSWESGPFPDTQTRLIFRSGFGGCSAAWAISLAGAEKILYRLSMSPFNDAIDMGVSTMCADGTLGINCISPFPAIIGVSKPAGSIQRGSDIRVESSDTPDGVREQAESEKLVFSTRLNIERLIARDTHFESSYPAITGRYMSLENIESGVGHGEWVD